MSRKYLKNICIGLAVVGIAAVTVAISPDKTAALGQPCLVGNCPKEITIKDTGGIFSYRVLRHFNVVLDAKKYSPKHLTCIPHEVVIETVSLPDLYPNHMKRFEAKNPGECILQNGDFQIKIIVVGTTTTSTAATAKL